MPPLKQPLTKDRNPLKKDMTPLTPPYTKDAPALKKAFKKYKNLLHIALGLKPKKDQRWKTLK